MTKKPIPIGIDDFHTVRDEGYYYVDKSMFVADIVRDSAAVILLPRPRRFGKSLNMSMLRYFYDSSDPSYEALFQGLEVTKHDDVMTKQGKHPVIYLSFKDAKSSSFQSFLKHCLQLVSEITKQLFDPIPTSLHLDHRNQLDELAHRRTDADDLSLALKLLTQLLHQVHGEKAVILIDEYDVPIQAGYQYGYYDEIITFMRNFLSAGFKGNIHLAKGVITGVLRVAKESIFSGLNNLRVYTLLNKPFSQYFGFTDAEVTKILNDYNLTNHLDQVRDWYNGYNFGETVVYNPWAIINHVDYPDEGFKPYWVNTGSDDMIRDLVLTSGALQHDELTSLLNKEFVTRELDETINLRDMSPRNIWSLLTFSGYLKPGRLTLEDQIHKYPLSIPNREVWYFWNKMIRSWAEQRLGEPYWSKALQALQQEDMTRFADELRAIVSNVLSFHDTARNQTEAFYHAFFLGLLSNLQHKYELRSNRESGYGRYDLALTPRDSQHTGFLFEFKKRDEETDLQSVADDALAQIRERNYAAELRDRGITKIIGLGVALDGKWVQVQHERL